MRASNAFAEYFFSMGCSLSVGLAFDANDWKLKAVYTGYDSANGIDAYRLFTLFCISIISLRVTYVQTMQAELDCCGG